MVSSFDLIGSLLVREEKEPNKINRNHWNVIKIKNRFSKKRASKFFRGAGRLSPSGMSMKKLCDFK